MVPVEVESPAASEISDVTLASDLIRPLPRRKSFPPIPDFRFEQSYLASLKNAQTNTQVAIITIRDQVLLPLAQGILWNLAMFGWRFWNRDVKFKGEGLGARIRKWWWGVNNWKVPSQSPVATRRDEFAKGAEEVSLVNKFARLMERRSV
jgi:hypothetical protein